MKVQVDEDLWSLQEALQADMRTVKVIMNADGALRSQSELYREGI